MRLSIVTGMPELEILGIKLFTVIISAPFVGWGLLQLSEVIKKAWESNNTRKKWIAMCLLYFAYAVLSGLLR